MPTDLEALLKPIPMTDAERELRAWIKLNKASLQDRSQAEVGYLAIECGFDQAVVFAVLSNFRDAMGGTQVESRARFALYGFNKACERVNEMKAKLAYVRELDLMPLWREVTYLQTNDRKALKRSR